MDVDTRIEPELASASAEEVIEAIAARAPRLALACSFQKEESVLLHLIARHAPAATVFALDTDVLFTETYDTWTRFEEFYGIEIERRAGISLEQQAAEHGDRLWERAPDRCCAIRKVAPLNAALSELDGWITGVRRDQAPTRANTPLIEWDERHDLWKANPLAAWSDQDVWRYVFAHKLPYNPLHDQDYSSLGCTHCTLPGAGREGRWAGSAKIECGLHPAQG